jgi:hypothetical protein
MKTLIQISIAIVLLFAFFVAGSLTRARGDQPQTQHAAAIFWADEYTPTGISYTNMFIHVTDRSTYAPYVPLESSASEAIAVYLDAGFRLQYTDGYRYVMVR